MEVDYISHMGSDITVVNAARVSFDKFTDHIEEKDERLIKYLARNKHISPFFHPQIQLRINVPIFVANQLKRHQIGFALNEVSRRYVDDDPVFYVPDYWRERPDKSIKQGSGGEITMGELRQGMENIYHHQLESSLYTYKLMLDNNIAPEMARMVLPQSMFTSWIWTGSLYAYARLCIQRLDSHAQKETRDVAEKISDIIDAKFPISWRALLERT